MMVRSTCAGLALALAALASAPAATLAQEPLSISAPADGTLVLLVRHAEKVEDDSRDPELSPSGHARAALLAGMLADAGLTAVWSTDYRRTRATAAPLADARGLDVRLYDPGSAEALEALADTLRRTPGRHLVVGHSNTTPALVSALGGDAGEPIAEDEYDRLYVLTLGPDGTVTTTLLRVAVGGG